MDINAAQASSPGSSAAFDQYLAAVRARRNAFVLTSVGLVTSVFGFVWASYTSVRENFSRDQVVAHAERVGTNLIEAAQPRLLDAAKDLAPVYRDEAKRALAAVLPKLRERTMAELELARDHLAQQSRTALQQAAVWPIEDALDDLMEQLPALHDERFVAELLRETESTLRTELEGALEDGKSIYQPQMNRLTTAMAALRSDELASASDDELVRRFTHLWLLLIDTELMGRAPCSLDSISMRTAPPAVRGG